MSSDTLGVSEYWDTDDYLTMKLDKQHAKEVQRDGEAEYTPISKYANAETARFISYFKSPRST